MEIYLLITGVVTFIGVVCIVVGMEKASRAHVERFRKEREDAQLQLQSLAAIYSLLEQTNALLGKLDTSQNEQTAQTASRLDALATRLDTLTTTTKFGLEQICRTGDEQGKNIQKTLQETSQGSAKQLESKLTETTKEIQALKTSLEESVKF